VEYVPQIGYLVSIDEQDHHFLAAKSDDYHFLYSNGPKLFYKHEYVLNLDDSIGDIRSTLLDAQKSVVCSV
jgi:hypothetical protein